MVNGNLSVKPVIRWILFFTAVLSLGCSSIRQSPKNGFVEGYYYSRLFHKKLKKLYVVPMDDSIKIYSA
ncbi:MAG: hypothetical protein ACXVBH_04070, partial [Flavisolibacter sp.]